MSLMGAPTGRAETPDGFLTPTIMKTIMVAWPIAMAVSALGARAPTVRPKPALTAAASDSVETRVVAEVRGDLQLGFLSHTLDCYLVKRFKISWH